MTKKRVLWMAEARMPVSPVYREGASFGMEEEEEGLGLRGVEGFADGVEAFRQVIPLELLGLFFHEYCASRIVNAT